MRIEFEVQVNSSFGKIADEVLAEWDIIVNKTADAILNCALDEIENGVKSGRVYDRGIGSVHQASAPGDAPASDSGDLVASGKSLPDGKMKAKVVFDSDHAVDLELGTEQIAARPFLLPATLAEKDTFEEKLNTALRRKR